MGQKLSAMKYVKNNKRRVAVLVVSLALSFVLTYLTNFLLMSQEETCMVCAVDNAQTVQYMGLMGSTLGIDVDNISEEEFEKQYLENNTSWFEVYYDHGDVNTNGNVDVMDLVRLKKIAALQADATAKSDINRDSLCNSDDMTILRQVLLGILN